MEGLLNKGKELYDQGKITNEDATDAFKQFSKGGDFKTNAQAAYKDYQENHKDDSKKSDDKKDEKSEEKK
ncbi:hypothetical protein PP707_06425 [Acetobacter pasteurianus]|uniref:uncharacterized protein n=1 Tax=Lodderomyces elongisporus TaxID=36914 RepID=UPI002923115B|nr:uncharacterized protein PVL30_001874 [Lodderomyces elongisporus]MDC6271918.1 hypothetical protein [Acetobacter pasteurianus]WLF78147.1 hypothetical protein PVL30_001874 [Lodderomyces elongisporus]